MMSINILGFGAMGRQVAALFQLSGWNVRAWNRSYNEFQNKRFEIEKRKLRKFLTFDADCGGTFERVESLASLDSAITYEALVEDLGVKKRTLEGLSYAHLRGTLFTNTSSYSPSEVHEQAIGLHFFNPIFSQKFVEVSTDPAELIDPVQDFVRQLSDQHGFDIVHVFDNRGYLGNYILFRDIAHALNMIQKFNYTSATIDKVLAHMGRAVSLFEIIDLVGVDITKKIIINLKEVDDSIIYPTALDDALSQNILGRKNGTTIRQILDQPKKV